ncbi:hypothetical protein NEOLEDRAFT_1102978 [Neolentinus lepideus HHB14362 ss-1]|uniref:Altered inheritance of mitochondria protein 9, mitochondrial n=1 Tax=Neolentinus lepideus HHB14362 ss-1 TaxID=1314782 RepID=A0A165MWZ7_9AGAM|nr:hypothetical protein NEOLEDRAFT_1102978 [Neolentinus lepideus HHB14362 ss-1]
MLATRACYCRTASIPCRSLARFSSQLNFCPCACFRGFHLTPSARPDNETLFRSSSRWLCNDDLQRKVRCAPFNPDALEQIACDAVGAERCISWTRIGEGSFNRIFLLRFDSGAEAVVRIPLPVIGNVQRAVASEVATMCYIRERWITNRSRNVPLPPKVLAWHSSYKNPAQTPYMILEYAPGIALYRRWPAIEGKMAGAALQSIFELEWALLRQVFSHHGSLYFAEDTLDSDECSRPLYVHDDCDPAEVNRKLAAKYRIGPTANREWGRPGYGDVDADRGPWPDLQTMIKSAAEFQLRAMDTVVDFSSPHIKLKPSDIPLLRRLLDTCILIAPLIIPSNPAMTAPVLNHPDLSLNNLIVPPDGLAYVHHVIDWQGATVSPFCMQCGVPPAIQYTEGVIPIPDDGSMPPWPNNLDKMSPSEQEYIHIQHRYACRHRGYALRIPSMDPLRGGVWALPHSTVLECLVPFITRCVSDGPLDLRGLLVSLQECWSKIADGPCPIDFTQAEIAAHCEEVEAQSQYERNVNKLHDTIGCLNDGSVREDQLEGAKKKMERCRQQWDERAMKGPFPFYEGAHSYYLT